MIHVPTRPDEKAALLRWAQARLPMEGNFDPATALPVAVIRDGDILAAVIYSEHRGATVEMTIASCSPRWATRETIATLLSWPFTGLGVRRISAVCSAHNTRSQRLVARLGFAWEGRLACWFGDDTDGIIYGLTRSAFAASRWAGSDMMRKAA